MNLHELYWTVKYVTILVKDSTWFYLLFFFSEEYILKHPSQFPRAQSVVFKNIQFTKQEKQKITTF